MAVALCWEEKQVVGLLLDKDRVRVRVGEGESES